MAVIKVPRTPKKAFNRDRRPSDLLLRQIEHLEWAVLPASQRKKHQLPKKKVKTEGQAAERVAQLMQMLPRPAAETTQSAAGATSPPFVPVKLPPLPPAGVPGRGDRLKSREGARRTRTRKRAKTARARSRSHRGKKAHANGARPQTRSRIRKSTSRKSVRRRRGGR